MGTWHAPALSLRWGEYQKPDATEEAAIVDSAVKAHDAGAITKRTLVEKIARCFGIDNVGSYMETLEEEAEERQEKAMAIAHAAGPESGPGEGEPPEGEMNGEANPEPGRGAGAKPPQATGRGGRTPRRAPPA